MSVPEVTKKITIEGLVYDPILDSGEIWVVNDNLDNLINDELINLESKKVRVTIEVLE